MLRTASDGTCDEPNERPSSVMLLAVGACPATENPAAVESLPVMLTTPGAVSASEARSEASSGRRAAWSALSARSTDPGAGRSPSRGTFCRACTVTAASTVGLVDILMLTTSRSSSAWRATLIVCGASPRALAMTRYWPPPSGKRTVNFPLSFVRARRVTFDSSDITSMFASSTGRFPSTRVTVPVMMSVVAPICADATAGMRNATAAKARRTTFAPKKPEFRCTGSNLWWLVTGESGIGLGSTAIVNVIPPAAVAVLAGVECETSLRGVNFGFSDIPTRSSDRDRSVASTTVGTPINQHTALGAAPIRFASRDVART